MSFWNLAHLWPFAIAFLGGLSGCSNLALSKPFEWPGLDARQGRLVGSSSDSVILVITHAELIGTHRTDFDRGADQVLAMLPAQPGLVGYSVRSRLIGHEVWTATVWIDEASINAFVRSPEHIAAVRQGAPAVKNVQYHRVKIPVSELPLNWSRVLAELQKAPRPPWTQTLEPGSSVPGVTQ